MLTVERLREVLTYDASTGELRWAYGRVGCRKNDLAGNVTSLRYRTIMIDRKRYFAHRLAWLSHYGEWPTRDLDHINCDPSDNRIENLRLTDAMHNQQNRHHARTDSLLGVIGISRCKRSGRFSAKIKVAGKQLHIGYYASPDQAYQAYLQVKRQLHSACTL